MGLFNGELFRGGQIHSLNEIMHENMYSWNSRIMKPKTVAILEINYKINKL